METTNLSRAEMDALRQLADRLGVTVEEAAEAAIRQGLNDMFLLPRTEARVIPFEGLNRPRQDLANKPNDDER